MIASVLKSLSINKSMSTRRQNVLHCSCYAKSSQQIAHCEHLRLVHDHLLRKCSPSVHNVHKCSQSVKKFTNAIFQVTSYVDPVKKEAEQQAHLDQSRLVQGRYETSSLSKVMITD